MNEFTVVVVLLAAVLVAAFARKAHLNPPLVVLAFALGASFMPGLVRVEVPPELILGIILPPLLYSAALTSSYQDFRAALQPIVRLGVGLVVVTALVVGFAAWYLDPLLSAPAAILLGAVVAPPDAVAAAAVGRRLGLPRRVMTLLGGESLINDATSLTLYRLALAAIYASGASIGQGAVVFALAVLVGVSVGLALAYVAQIARAGLRDPAVDTVIGLMLPFVSYWIAEEYHGSGVLAVVTAGFFIGQSSPRTTVATRLHEEPIWASVDLMLESFTFAFIGLQLRWVIADVDASDQDLGDAILLTVVVLAVTLAVRPVYIYSTELLVRSRWLQRWRDRRGGPGRTGGLGQPSSNLSARELLVTSWAGMRGVVTLAAAAGIPAAVDGRPFAERATVQMAAYFVAIGTLLIQGLTLPSLIRALKISSEDEKEEDDASEARVRLLATRAASQVVRGQVEAWTPIMGKTEAERIAEWATQGLLARETAAATLMHPEADLSDGELLELTRTTAPAVIAEARQVLRSAGAGLPEEPESDLPPPDPEEMRAAAARLTNHITELRTQMVRAQREVVVAERNAGRLGESVMRRIMREFDLEEEAMEASWAHRL
ncbi:MAG: cation:proton antiporter [Bifidobacteriaceae bacterium]|jgi:CPA1 family monovalent cation:H+ antiporter|nr:cation:proton antiporter [Bifidobacteriaceae bacterium]